MKAGFKDTVYDIKDGFTGFIIWFVSNIPYIAFWSVVIVVVVIVINKKRKNKLRIIQKIKLK